MRLECLVSWLQDQYRFCYELVQSYLDEFATYANFRWETLPSQGTASVQIIVCLTDCVTCAVLLTRRVIYVDIDRHWNLLLTQCRWPQLILSVGRVIFVNTVLSLFKLRVWPQSHRLSSSLWSMVTRSSAILMYSVLCQQLAIKGTMFSVCPCMHSWSRLLARYVA